MEQIQTQERNGSLDLLRIIAMFMILSSHFFGWGGVVNKLTTRDLNYYIAMPIYFVCGIGNTLFFLLAGYFAKPPKLKKALFIQRKTCFYAFLISLLVFCFGWNHDIGIGYVLKSLFPVIHNRYWFVSVYLILYILSFVLIPGLESLSKTQFLLVIGALLIHNTCIMDASLTLMEGLLAYTVGYYLKKFKPYENDKKVWIVSAYAVFMAVYVVERFVVRRLGIEHTLVDEGLRYALLLGAAVAMFSFFAKLNIQAKWASKISGNVLSVYLISACPAWAPVLYTKWLHIEAFCQEVWFVGYYLLLNVAIFAVCIFIDKAVTHVNNKEVSLIEKLVNKIVKKQSKEENSKAE